MNDDEFMTAVREPLADVHMTTPLDEVTRRGTALRNHRRLRGVTGVTALAGAIAVAAALLVPGGTSTPPAWTVTKVSDDTIKVTINNLTDPQGLQRELRADGIRARVDYDASPYRHINPHNTKAWERYERRYGFTLVPPSKECVLPGDVMHGLMHPHGGVLFTIRASDFPKGTGIAIVAGGQVKGNKTLSMAVTASKVIATPKCLGS